MKLFILAIFFIVSALADPQYASYYNGYPGYTFSSPYYGGYPMIGYPYYSEFNNAHFVSKREAVAEPESESSADAVPEAESEASARPDARILRTYTTYGQSYPLTPFKKQFRSQPQGITFLSRQGQFLGQQQGYPFFQRQKTPSFQRQKIFPSQQQRSPFFPRQSNPSFPRQKQFPNQQQGSPIFPRQENHSSSRRVQFPNQQQGSPFFPRRQGNPSFQRQEQFPNQQKESAFPQRQWNPSFPMQRQGNPSFQRQEEQGNRFTPIKMLEQSNVDLVRKPGQFPSQPQGSRAFPQQRNPSFPNSEKDSMDLSNLPGKMYPAVPEDLGVVPRQEMESPTFPTKVQNPDQQQVSNFQQQVNRFFQSQKDNKNSQQGIISV